MKRKTVNLDVPYTCLNCGYPDVLSRFKDGMYKQGAETFLVFRCPVCFALQGRLNIDTDFKHANLHDLFRSYLSSGARSKQ